MKICPDCALANEERFPVCVVCSASLAEVRSTPSRDPHHPEHARRELQRQRRWAARRQAASAAFFQGLVITGLAVYPGFVWDPPVLALYAASALVVAWTVWREWAGSFRAGFLQGAAGVVLLRCFGPMQPFAMIMLAGQVLVAMVFGQWTEMTRDAHR